MVQKKQLQKKASTTDERSQHSQEGHQWRPFAKVEGQVSKPAKEGCQISVNKSISPSRAQHNLAKFSISPPISPQLQLPLGEMVQMEKVKNYDEWLKEMNKAQNRETFKTYRDQHVKIKCNETYLMLEGHSLDDFLKKEKKHQPRSLLGYRLAWGYKSLLEKKDDYIDFMVDRARRIVDILNEYASIKYMPPQELRKHLDKHRRRSATGEFEGTKVEGNGQGQQNTIYTIGLGSGALPQETIRIVRELRGVRNQMDMLKHSEVPNTDNSTNDYDYFFSNRSTAPHEEGKFRTWHQNQSKQLPKVSEDGLYKRKNRPESWAKRRQAYRDLFAEDLKNKKAIPNNLNVNSDEVTDDYIEVNVGGLEGAIKDTRIVYNYKEDLVYITTSHYRQFNDTNYDDTATSHTIEANRNAFYRLEDDGIEDMVLLSSKRRQARQEKARKLEQKEV